MEQEEYVVTELANCPRCWFKSYEQLSTHSHCVDCNYSPTIDVDDSETAIPLWAIEALTAQNVADPETPETILTRDVA